VKSNVWVRKLTNAFVILAWLGVAPNAFAQSNPNLTDEDYEESLSEIGIERGLELYPRDKADTCVAGALQIRVTVSGVAEQGLLKLELFGEYPGEYAVVGYHDQDGDRRLKKAWNFKPKEPYGLSNNPEIKSLRLPKFSETKFIVPMEGVDIDIHLVDLTKK